MIYIADGPSDVPVFSVLWQYGGKTIGVYKPKDLESFQQVNTLQEEQRVQSIAPADYRLGEPAYLTILTAVNQIANRIVGERLTALRQRVGRPPRHLVATQESVIEQLRLEAAAVSDVVPPDAVSTSNTPITDRTLDSKQELFAVPPVQIELEAAARRRVIAQMGKFVIDIENDTHVPISPEEISQLERYALTIRPRRSQRGR